MKMSVEPTIRCTNVAESIEFLCNVLDFELVIAPDPDPEEFMSKYGAVRHGDSLVHVSAHAGDGRAGAQLYMRVPDVDALFARFVARGLDSETSDATPGLAIAPVDQSWGMREFTLRDASGNRFTYGWPLAPQSPQVVDTTHVLAVNDLDQSRSFFCDQLGFKEIHAADGWVFVQRGACMIRMGRCPDVRRVGEDHAWFAYLHTDDARALFDEVQASGVTIWGGLEDKPWRYREFGVVGPEGHRIVFGQPI